MWCVISPSSWCPSCTVTAGWAPGMGGLISSLSIRSLLAVLEMGGNTIPLQFDFKPHRSISWTPFSGAAFYHSLPILHICHLLSLSESLSSPLTFILFCFLQPFVSITLFFLTLCVKPLAEVHLSCSQSGLSLKVGGHIKICNSHKYGF